MMIVEFNVKQCSITNEVHALVEEQFTNFKLVRKTLRSLLAYKIIVIDKIN